MKNSLTIIVPTRNRPAFLRRLLLYFSRQKVASRLLVIDSSDSDDLLQNSDIVRHSSSELNIVLVPDQSAFDIKCRRAMEMVKTPYSVFCADDDFLLPDTVDLCVEFLDANSEYSGAMGSWVSMNPSRANRCHQTRCFAIEDNDPLVRFRQLANSWFANFYGIFRTEVLRQSWIITDKVTEYERGRVFTEALLSHLTVLYGKQAMLPQLQLLFQLHDENEHRTQPLVADKTATTALYHRFAHGLAEEMARVSQTSVETCRELVDSNYGFWLSDAPEGVGQTVSTKRLRKNLSNQILLLRDMVFRSSTNIWLRRRIHQKDRLCQTDSWKLAFEMAAAYPLGIERHCLPLAVKAA